MKRLKNFFYQRYFFNKSKQPCIIISSTSPSFTPVILSKFFITIFIIVSLFGFIGTCLHSSHIFNYLLNKVLLKTQISQNLALTNYYKFLPDSINLLTNRLLATNYHISQNRNLLSKKEWLSQLPADWNAFNPTVPIFHPFCCPGFTNSDSTVSIIKKLFKDFNIFQLHSFACPVSGWITSGFGMRTDPVFEGTAFHKGIDIAAPIGTKIHCAADGIVIFCGRKPLLGNTISIQLNQTKLITIYGHLHSITVSREDSVFQGQIIGYVGSTGKSTGPHLHFEVRLGEVPINPISMLLPLDTLLD